VLYRPFAHTQATCLLAVNSESVNASDCIGRNACNVLV